MKTSFNAFEATNWLQQNTEMLECQLYRDAHLTRCILSVKWNEQTFTKSAYGHDATQACQRVALKLFHKLSENKGYVK